MSNMKSFLRSRSSSASSPDLASRRSAGPSLASHPLLRQLRSRLEATTPRERALLLVLAAGGAGLALVSAIDAADSARTRYAEAVLAERTARARSAEASRAEDPEVVADRLASLERWRFDAVNLDSVAVELEQRLGAMAADAGLPDARVRVEPPAEPSEGAVTWVPASVEGPLVWGPTFDFLDLVASWAEAHQVAGLNLEVRQLGSGARPQPGRPIGQFRVDFLFPVQLRTPEAET